MQITVTIPDELAAQLRARGKALEAFVAGLVSERLSQEHTAADSRSSAAGPGNDRSSVADAIDRIRALRRGNNLGSLAIKELIHEGHKY